MLSSVFELGWIIITCFGIAKGIFIGKCRRVNATEDLSKGQTPAYSLTLNSKTSCAAFSSRLECKLLSFQEENKRCNMYTQRGPVRSVSSGEIFYTKDLKDYCTACDGYHYVGNEQLCLKYYQTSVKYSQAFDACASDTSTLVKVDSKQKQEAIFQFLTDTQGLNNWTFIQGHRETTGSSNWMFDDSTKLTYLPWNAGQSDNHVGDNYLSINTAGGGHWHDVNGVSKFFFLCEKNLL